MEKEQFLKEYKLENNLNDEQYHELLINNHVFKCSCEEPNCKGWNFLSLQGYRSTLTMTEDIILNNK